MRYELIKKRIKENDIKLLELVQEERTYDQVIEVLSTSIKLMDYTRRYLHKCKLGGLDLQEAESLLEYYMEEN